MKSLNESPADPGVPLGEDLHRHRRGDRRFVLWLVLALACLTAVAFAARPAYRHLKISRAQRIAQGVQARLDAGDAMVELPRVRLMLSLAPNDAQVLRTAARFCSSNNHPDAITYWETLLTSVPGTREDHLAYAQAAMDRGRYEVATRELGVLLQRPGGDVDAARLALRLSVKRGAWEFAARMAEHVLELSPADEQAQIWRDMALIRTRQPEKIARARISLLAMMVRPGEHWREAMDLLFDVPELTRAEIAVIRRRLRDEGSDRLDDQLRSLSVDWLSEPGQHEQVTAHAIHLLASARPGPDVGMVGRWLLDHGQAEHVLEVLPLDEARRDKTKLQTRLLALVRLERWEDVSALVGEPEIGLDPHVITMMSIAAAAALKPNTGHEDRVAAVVAERNLTLADLLEAAQLAEENGLTEAAIYLLGALLDNPATMPEAANRILWLDSRVNWLTLRRRALQRLVNVFPNDPVALQQLGYVEAVLPGGDLGIVTRIQRLPGAATNQFAQLICALAEVRQGMAEAALTRLNAVASPDQPQDYRLHLAYAAAYGGAGNRSEARRHAALADRGRLQFEERDLISRWLPAKEP